ncbi:hypothetical protein J7U46_07170 [Pelomonas sp. V22]|uniref:hypothetical protein n=1 Tax=Pelomonas sp. V22 TaxID=2822139 RepID=UPI0024A7AE1E|nr:hypothetical protein [Pelomonas sp. V22]MDI4632824.1 hypothetical protein [Pelomonas sp. V22]
MNKQMMRQARWRLATSLLCLVAGAQAMASELLISQQLLADGAVEIRYTPPAGQRELRFLDTSTEAHKRWRGTAMQAVGACTELTETGLRLREAPGCETAVLRLKQAAGKTGGYEPAQLLSDSSGVLAYSGRVAVLLPGQALRWRWLPPQGGIVIHQGRVERKPVEQLASAEQVDQVLAGGPFELQRQIGAAQFVYMGSDKGLLSLPGGNLLLDPTLDALRAERIAKVLKYTLNRLAALYGVALPRPGGVVVAVSELSGFHGDTTAGPMMRLRLPRNAETMPGLTLEQFVTHELVHWWNTGLFTPDHQRPWLHEGHAEWMARLLLREQGLLSDAELRADIETNLNNCAAVRGARPAATMKPGRAGDDVYACGMSLMLLGQAQRDAADGGRTAPLAQMAPLHSLERALDPVAFVAWADAGSPAASMRQLLQDEQQPFTAGLLARLQALGLSDAEPLRRSDQLPKGLRDQTAVSLMSALMASDCGAASVFTRPTAFHLDPDSRCKSLRVGADVQQLAGVAVLEDPVAAFAAVAASCRESRSYSVGYREGEPGRVACPEMLPVPPLSQLIRLRPDALRRLKL